MVVQKKLRTVAKVTALTLLFIALGVLCYIAYRGSFMRTSQLSAYSDRWNDLSELREAVRNAGIETKCLVSSPLMLRELTTPQNYILLVIGVERPYTTSEGYALYEFVNNGGAAIIADDFGAANSVSQYFFGVRFSGRRLWDENYEKNPRFIKLHDIEWTGLEGTYDILLNEPSTIETYASGRALVESSPHSWVDKNGNGTRDPEELYGTYPIVVERMVGKGIVLFISDPSLFINDMWGRAENSAFTIALLRYLQAWQQEQQRWEATEAGASATAALSASAHMPLKTTVIFDESRHLPSGLAEALERNTYELFVTLTTDSNFRVFTPLLALLILGTLIIVFEEPRIPKSNIVLGPYPLQKLRNFYLSSSDAGALRLLALERLRRALGMSIEEFRNLTAEELAAYIKDYELTKFLLHLEVREYSTAELESLLPKISALGRRSVRVD